MTNCNQCGVCCKIFLINLTEEEYNSKKYKTVFSHIEHFDDFLEAEMIGANILAKCRKSQKEAISEHALRKFDKFPCVQKASLLRTQKHEFLTNEDEICIYLENDICKIHEMRPQSCRNFFCDSDNIQFKEMIKEIKNYKSNE